MPYKRDEKPFCGGKNMTDSIDARLEQLGIQLPAAAAPAANYVPFTTAGGMLFISGQLPMADGKIAYTGKLGDSCSLEQGQAAARQCGLNILAQVKAALDSLDRVERCLKLGGFVNCTPDFSQHPAVINGASDLMADVLGPAGAHARFAVGAPNLPFDASVEIDAIFAMRN